MFRSMWVKINRTECPDCNHLRALFRSASWKCSRCLFDSRHSRTGAEPHVAPDPEMR